MDDLLMKDGRLEEFQLHDGRGSAPNGYEYRYGCYVNNLYCFYIIMYCIRGDSDVGSIDMLSEEIDAAIDNLEIDIDSSCPVSRACMCGEQFTHEGLHNWDLLIRLGEPDSEPMACYM